MKNNCDVSGKRTYCKTPEMVFGGSQREIECDHRDKRGSCSNLAAIRAAIEAERMETIGKKIAAIRADAGKKGE